MTVSCRSKSTVNKSAFGVRLVALCLASVTIAGPVMAQTPAGAPAAPASASLPAGYVIGPEDVLTIVFWRDKDMSADVTVRPDGKISLPLINDIHAADLTPDQLREEIVKR